jgi:hypothetical protein
MKTLCIPYSLLSHKELHKLKRWYLNVIKSAQFLQIETSLGFAFKNCK